MSIKLSEDKEENGDLQNGLKCSSLDYIVFCVKITEKYINFTKMLRGMLILFPEPIPYNFDSLTT